MDVPTCLIAEICVDLSREWLQCTTIERLSQVDTVGGDGGAALSQHVRGTVPPNIVKGVKLSSNSRYSLSF
jgi:hypothetical protein